MLVLNDLRNIEKDALWQYLLADVERELALIDGDPKAFAVADKKAENRLLIAADARRFRQLMEGRAMLIWPAA